MVPVARDRAPAPAVVAVPATVSDSALVPQATAFHIALVGAVD